MATQRLASALDDEVVEELRGAVRGSVVAEGDEGYDEERRVWNGMIERRPALVVGCRGAADVAAAVRFARGRGLPLSVRGGGHNVSGLAVAEGGVVVDLAGLADVRVDLDRRTVRVGGGARLGDVDRETQAHGLAVPFGVVSRTGVGGLALHGGFGFLARRYGLTCDSLVGADVVTADGALLHVDEERHPDLLWALRGGGGGFGVVTSFEFRLHPVGPEVWMLLRLFPAEATEQGLAAFADAMAEAPEELMAVAISWNAPADEPVPPEWHGRPVLVVAGCWSGPLEQAEEAVRPLCAFAEPVADLSGPMPYAVAQQLFDPEYPDGRRYYWKSTYLDDVHGAARVLGDAAAARPSPLSSIDVWALGGAVRRSPDGGSAFARRDAPFLVGIEANWDDPDGDDANVGWARRLYGDLQPYGSGGAYLNFPGFVEEGDALLRASFGASYDRLRTVKAAYDPDDVFSSTLGVPPGA